MIDWLNLLTHLFWLMGLALILATLNYYSWLAQHTQTSVWQQWQQVNCQRPVWGGFLLITMGLAGTSQQVWEIGVWGIMAVTAGWHLWQLLSTSST